MTISPKPLSEGDMEISLPLKVKNAIELMNRKQQIIYLSYHDELTGLYNRRFFEEQLKMLDTPANLPIAILMGDINGLKVFISIHIVILYLTEGPRISVHNFFKNREFIVEGKTCISDASIG